MPPSGYFFGPFRYDPEQRALFRDTHPVALAPKAIDTLHALLEHPGRIVEKDDLIRKVWPDTTVEDVGLARNISILRKALGDEADEAIYIETVPRRGYRFIGEVRTAQTPETPVPPPEGKLPPRSRRAFWTALAAASFAALAGLVLYWQFYSPGPYLKRGQGARASIAVIPFDSLGGVQDSDAFSRGLEESLAASLSQLRGVHVISPGTVHRYTSKGIPVAVMSRLLRLDAVVEGTIQRSDETIRITARMPDVHSGKLIWAQTFDFNAADPVAAQSEAAARIALAVENHLQTRQ